MSKQHSVGQKEDEILNAWEQTARRLSEEGRLAWVLGQGLSSVIASVSGDGCFKREKPFICLFLR